MKHKLELFQAVVLTRDIAKSRQIGLIEGDHLASGSYGVVVDYLVKGGVCVEFFNRDGETIEVASLPESYLRPATAAELEDRVASAHGA
jgi:hypothetical protein